MPRAVRPDPRLAASVADELADLPAGATDAQLTAHLESILAVRSTWAGGWRSELGELDRLEARSLFPSERLKFKRERERTLTRLRVGASPSGPFFPRQLRNNLCACIDDRKPLLRLIELYSFDRLSFPVIYGAAPGLAVSERRMQLERARTATSAAQKSIRRFQACIAALEPETFTPINDLVGGFGAHAAFAREVLDACDATLPHLQRVQDVIAGGLETPAMKAHRRADWLSRQMALRVVATVVVAGLDDGDAVEVLEAVHGYVRDNLRTKPQRGAVRVIADPVPHAKSDLDAFRRIRSTYSPDRIRVGLTLTDASAALIKSRRRKRRR